MKDEETGLQVYKFGGASVKDAAAILNLCRIVRDFGPKGPLLIVVSAMGKTTNALEEIYDLAYHGRDFDSQLRELENFHCAIADAVASVPDDKDGIPLVESEEQWLGNLLKELRACLSTLKSGDYDQQYDQVVSYGELLSSLIVAHVLQAQWLDCRSLVQTDQNWREGRIDWPTTELSISVKCQAALLRGTVVTQGFIGSTADGRTTTLGREGSDYSAAIFAYCLRADAVTIWKDVPGLLNADPKIFSDTVLYPEISYQETIEMAFYGASVIHPKTLKPLAERGIPLRVKSFLDPVAPGTLIHDCQHPPLVPAFIRKAGQGLLSFESKDFAFISEENLEVIFGALARVRLKINVMQNSAISFSVVVDFNEMRVQRLLELLGGQFRIQYNTDLTLFTIKHYDQASVERLTSGRVLLLEQRTRSTFQFLVRE